MHSVAGAYCRLISQTLGQFHPDYHAESNLLRRNTLHEPKTEYDLIIIVVSLSKLHISSSQYEKPRFVATEEAIPNRVA